jgi:cytosine deaminase
MLYLQRARVPVALLPASLAAPAPDALEPSALCDLGIDGPRLAAVAPAGTPPPAGATVVDLAGALTFPGFVDAHVHLDKTHTWGRAPNRSGTFAEALEVLFQDKDNWNAADVRRRADFGLRCAWEHGTRLIRTHVDTWYPGSEESHAVLQELRAAWRGRIELQTVPLTGIANYAGAEGTWIADLALKYGASALGGFSLMSTRTATRGRRCCVRWPRP